MCRTWARSSGPGPVIAGRSMIENTEMARELGLEPSVLATRNGLEELHERQATGEGVDGAGELRRWQAELLLGRISAGRS